MALPVFTMRQLLEAGAHFGHTTRRWNPKMQDYLFGDRNGIHIIDLQQTAPMLHRSMSFVRDVVAGGGRVLFVGTKRQAQEVVANSAKRCGQYYVNHRWLGGMLTNWNTVSKSIRRLHSLDEELAKENTGYTKKELLNLTREHEKLERALGGIKDMGGLPGVLFVIDVNKEDIAILEAQKLGIPVVAVVDSNCNPKGIDYVIPGNDDSIRAITLYCDLIAGSVIDGIQEEMVASGVDIGEMEEAPAEEIPTEAPVEESKAEEPKAEEAKAEKAPAKEAKAKEAKAKKAPAKEAKAEEAPAEEAKAEEAPAEEAKAEEAKAEEAPAEEAKAEEAPAEEAKAEEVPAEDSKA